MVENNMNKKDLLKFEAPMDYKNLTNFQKILSNRDTIISFISYYNTKSKIEDIMMYIDILNNDQ